MGSGAGECRNLERVVEESNGKRYGRRKSGNPRYDNNYWEDVTGKVRAISDMDSMHLCFVISFLRRGNPSKFKTIRERVMVEELKCRGFTKEDYDSNLESVRLGLYCMYPREGSTELERYYSRLLNRGGC